MSNLRDVYAQKALAQIPRLLSLQDRNRFSPTYGSFKRAYWMDKTVDYIDGLPQYGVSSLVMAYTQDMPGNQFYKQEKVREWAIAGMKYWAKVQHGDGSYDEFYPNERGWTGPTGFLLYAMMKSYMFLDDIGEFPSDFRDEFLSKARRSADYIAKWDEHGVLANHHAMGVLPVYYAYHVIQDEKLKEGYEAKLADFLSYHYPEGWSLEYDGADIGYLSATVSFLGKVYKLNKDERLLKVMKESTEFLSYFVYPNGFYAGSAGSRQTLHFYSHGCEILAPHMPLAGKIAEAMLQGLSEGKVVPAEIQSDRYFLYRIPEHLESYIDYSERTPEIQSTQLPYERPDFTKVFPDARMYIQKRKNIYLVANAAKGGVTKVFNTDTKKQYISDCGIIGKATDGSIYTSQWIDNNYNFVPKEDSYSISGFLHKMPHAKIFTPIKSIIFRVFMILFGWNAALSYRIKGFIRSLLVTKSGGSPVLFYRSVKFEGDTLITEDIIKIANKKLQFSELQISDEIFVRYVPQSAYFQSQEFDAQGYLLNEQQLAVLNDERKIQLTRTLDLKTGEEAPPKVNPVVMGTMGLEYSEGRKKRRALKYRLRRRGDELIRSIKTYYEGEPEDLLDMGPAEGKMLSLIQDEFPNTKCTGLEFSPELIDACEDDRLTMVQGDAMDPPFKEGSFDIITASAIIEHVDSPLEFLVRAQKLLRPGGLVIITTPDPFFDQIAEKIGHVADDIHQELITIKKLRHYIKEAGFEPVEVEKFMCFPWGLPGELAIEKVMKKLGLSRLLLNQLGVGKKASTTNQER